MTQRIPYATFSALSIFVLLAVLAFLFVPKESPSRVSLSVTAMESLNRRNALVKNVFCPSIRTGLLSRSSIFYEKPNRMLFVSASAWREEAIIGCDGIKYWFWMRSFDKNSIYFCPLDRLDSTPLIPLMRPEVVSLMAWVDELEGDAKPFGDGYRTEHTKGRFRKVVDFDREKITRQEIFMDGNPIVSLRALEFGRFSGMSLPTKVEAKWSEQGMSGTFTIDGWIINADPPEISEPKGLHRRDMEKL